MITKEKLALNLKSLKSRIPVKPKEYDKDYPRTIKDALNYYCNQSTLHAVQACTSKLNEENWPMPLWFDSENIKVGFWNKFYYKKQYNSWQKGVKFSGFNAFDFFSVHFMNNYFFNRTYDESIVEAFEANSKYTFQRFLRNPLLQPKRIILESIQRSFNTNDWIACISTIFPLVDFIARKILKTNNLGIDVSKICKLFKENGFSLENAGELMPLFKFISSSRFGESLSNKESNSWLEKMEETDFGLIGTALSSFIHFANIYYGYYKEEQETNNDITLLNRHAILHGSINNFGSKVNTIKLLTFLYLVLELEFVFEILFEE